MKKLIELISAGMLTLALCVGLTFLIEKVGSRLMPSRLEQGIGCPLLKRDLEDGISYATIGNPVPDRDTGFYYVILERVGTFDTRLYRLKEKPPEVFRAKWNHEGSAWWIDYVPLPKGGPRQHTTRS